MELIEAKNYLNSKGYQLIDEATSSAVRQKVEFAKAIRDDFGGKTELTDEEYNQLKSYDPGTIMKWIFHLLHLQLYIYMKSRMMMVVQVYGLMKAWIAVLSVILYASHSAQLVIFLERQQQH